MKRIFTLLICVAATQHTFSQFILKDIFNRDLSGEQIILVDWEGHMSNPAIRLTIQAKNDASFPQFVTIKANSPRLYFDNFGSAGASGPQAGLVLRSSAPVSFHMSIFPDRGGGNENYVLSVISGSSTQTFAIKVIDQDADSPQIDYNVITDFTNDNISYNFFSTLRYRQIVRQAADDWAFFLEKIAFDTVPVFNENSFIWNDDFLGGRFVQNPYPYNGFLLNVYGTHNSAHRSGGEGTYNAFQKIKGVETPLRRSGGYLAEVHGNYNTLRYDTTLTDDTWYKATNYSYVPNDLYSIAIHEMGHAFGFNPAYPRFMFYKNQGFIDDPEVVAYQGTNVPVDGSDHLANGQNDDELKFVDRISKKGCFGSEYARLMPNGPWLITKLNLLCLKAIGYKIKPTSAFKNVSIVSPDKLESATYTMPYSSNIIAEGGIPFYNYEVSSGTLPSGLSLNSFTGALSGNPTALGSFSFSVKVTDYDNQYSIKAFTLNVEAALPTTFSCPNDTIVQSASIKAKVIWRAPNNKFPETLHLAGLDHSIATKLNFKGSFADHGYYESNEQYHWSNANNILSGSNGHLVTINSAAENAFINTYINERGNYAWIGLTNTGRPGSFAWVTSEPLDYTNWAPGQPDNLYGMDNADTTIFEPYVHINGFDSLSRWNDNGSHAVARILAEFDHPILNYRQISGPANGDSLSAGTYKVCYEETNTATGVIDTCCFNITVISQPTYSADDNKKVTNTAQASQHIFSARAISNPSTTSFTININSNNSTEKITVEVSDATGKIVDRKNNILGGNTLRLGNEYAPGIYFARISQGVKFTVLKLVKK